MERPEKGGRVGRVGTLEGRACERGRADGRVKFAWPLNDPDARPRAPADHYNSPVVVLVLLHGVLDGFLGRRGMPERSWQVKKKKKKKKKKQKERWPRGSFELAASRRRLPLPPSSSSAYARLIALCELGLIGPGSCLIGFPAVDCPPSFYGRTCAPADDGACAAARDGDFGARR